MRRIFTKHGHVFRHLTGYINLPTEAAFNQLAGELRRPLKNMTGTYIRDMMFDSENGGRQSNNVSQATLAIVDWSPYAASDQPTSVVVPP